MSFVGPTGLLRHDANQPLDVDLGGRLCRGTRPERGEPPRRGWHQRSPVAYRAGQRSPGQPAGDVRDARRHGRNDHGPQHVRAHPRRMGRFGLERLVGRYPPYHCPVFVLPPITRTSRSKCRALSGHVRIAAAQDQPIYHMKRARRGARSAAGGPRRSTTSRCGRRSAARRERRADAIAVFDGVSHGVASGPPCGSVAVAEPDADRRRCSRSPLTRSPQSSSPMLDTRSHMLTWRSP